MHTKRANIYFNTQIQEEKEIWDYINQDGKRSYIIKKALWTAMKADKGYTKQEVSENIEEKDETPTIEELQKQLEELKKEKEKPRNTIPQNNEPLKSEDFDDSAFA